MRVTQGLRAALVTGASSGIGEAFAQALAARGTSLLLAARSEDRLRALANDLAARHDLRVEVVPVDLADRDGPRRLQAAADERGFEPDLVVNNAGLGRLGRFVEGPLERQLEMVHLNVEALVALTGLYLPRMVARRSGAILNVASTAAFQPLPHFAVYAASKAFVMSFSAALWAEHRRDGVRVMALCPGPVADTRFGEGGANESRFFHDVRAMPREAVVEYALRALDHNKPIATPGLSNRLIGLAVNAFPRRLQLTLSEHMFRRRANEE